MSPLNHKRNTSSLAPHILPRGYNDNTLQGKIDQNAIRKLKRKIYDLFIFSREQYLIFFYKFSSGTKRLQQKL